MIRWMPTVWPSSIVWSTKAGSNSAGIAIAAPTGAPAAIGCRLQPPSSNVCTTSASILSAMSRQAKGSNQLGFAVVVALGIGRLLGGGCGGLLGLLLGLEAVGKP